MYDYFVVANFISYIKTDLPCEKIVVSEDRSTPNLGATYLQKFTIIPLYSSTLQSVKKCLDPLFRENYCVDVIVRHYLYFMVSHSSHMVYLEPP